MALISAFACALLTPLFIRANTICEGLSRRTSAAGMESGIHKSRGRPEPESVNPRGSTPITVYGLPLLVRPKIAAQRRLHSKHGKKIGRNVYPPKAVPARPRL